MKSTLIVFLTCLMAEAVSFASFTESGNDALDRSGGKAEDPLLEFYLQFSKFTDPAGYACLYESLPDSLPELCRLIKSQFIHPHAELPEYSDLIPQERWREAMSYPTVASILEGLMAYDSRGFISNRSPEDRLILGCRHYSILLASILKCRGIPARVRYGHATYLIPGFHASHTVCEVWDEKEKRWLLVDPATGMIDLNREEFDRSNEAWIALRKDRIDPSIYGSPGKGFGEISILSKISIDLASLLGTEYTIYQYAPVMKYAIENDNQLTAEQLEIIDRVCELMRSIDQESISELREIYENTPYIQVSLTFIPPAVNGK